MKKVRTEPQLPPKTELDPVCTEVCRTLQRKRIEAGLSLNKLEKRSTMTRQTIDNVETAERSPYFETVVRIARGLKLRLSDVVREAERRV